MLRKIPAFIVLTFLIAAGRTTPALALDVCSDSYLTSQFQAELRNAENATGVCGTARAAMALYQKNIKLLDKCQHIPGLRSFRTELEGLLVQAKQQAASSCS